MIQMVFFPRQGERMLTVEEVQHRTMEASLNFDHLQRVTIKNNSVQGHDQRSWQPPPPDVLKIRGY
jgi:hypothetical protein